LARVGKIKKRIRITIKNNLYKIDVNKSQYKKIQTIIYSLVCFEVYERFASFASNFLHTKVSPNKKVKIDVGKML